MHHLPTVHALHAWGDSDSCGLSPPFASRSRDLVRRERRHAGPCLWSPRWAANTRQPARRRDLVELAARRRSWGSCPSQSSSCLPVSRMFPSNCAHLPFTRASIPAQRFSNSGRSAAFPASGRSMAQPPARRRICTERPITDVQARLLGLRRQSSRTARALAPVTADTALGFASRRFADTSRCACLASNSRHTASPGTSASGSLRS